MRVTGIPYVQGRNAYTDTDGRKYGIAIHNTANDASAENEASYATRRTDGISGGTGTFTHRRLGVMAL